MTLAIFPVVPSYSQTYVALATLLPPELRPRASCAGLCYIELARQVSSDLYRARVVALPHYLNGSYVPKVFALLLSADEVAQALPFDRDLQYVPTCDLRELVEQHVRQSGGSLPEREEQAILRSPTRKRKEESSAPFAIELFVSDQTVADAAEVIDEPKRTRSRAQKRRATLQLIWLQSAIMMMRRQMACARTAFAGKLYSEFRKLHQYLCGIFTICHQTSQAFTCAGPVFIEGRQVGWHVLVRIPAQLLAA